MEFLASLSGPRWQMRWIEVERRTLEEKISVFPDDATEARLSIVDHRIDFPDSENSSIASIQRYVAAVKGCSIALCGGLRDGRRIRNYLATARSILQSEQISEEHKALGVLPLEIQLLNLRLLILESEWNKALWISSKLITDGRLLSIEEFRPRLLYEHALCCLRLGQIKRAVETCRKQDGPEFSAILHRCQVLAGQYPPLRGLSVNLTEFEDVQNIENYESLPGWFSALTMIRELRDTELRSWIKSQADPSKYLWALALLFGTGRFTLIKGIAKLRSRNRDRAFRSANDASFLQCIQTIEQCFDVTRPLRHRIDQLEAMLASTSSLNAIEMEIIVLSAACRWLRKIHQSELAQTVEKRLSIIMSEVSEEFKSLFYNSSGA